MNELWAFLQSWLPFFILIGAWWLLTFRARRNSNEVVAQNQGILDINRRMLAVLEEISAELKQRKS
jgi:hypothetical protein